VSGLYSFSPAFSSVIWAGAGVALALISLGGISGTLSKKGSRRFLAALAYLRSLSFSIISALGSQHGGRALSEATDGAGGDAQQA
jgi:hypothetical protein